jgi:hypothetical protein
VRVSNLTSHPAANWLRADFEKVGIFELRKDFGMMKNQK